jgi:hypothetical protein
MAHRQAAITEFGADEVDVAAGEKGVWRRIYSRVHHLKKTRHCNDDKAVAACKSEYEPTEEQRERIAEAKKKQIAIDEGDAKLTDIEALLQTVIDKSAAREVEVSEIKHRQQLLSRIGALEIANSEFLPQISTMANVTEWLKLEMFIWQKHQVDDFAILAGQTDLLWKETDWLRKAANAAVVPNVPHELHSGWELVQPIAGSDASLSANVIESCSEKRRGKKRGRDIQLPKIYATRSNKVRTS